jgi:L-cysteine desulfidase
MADTDRIFEIAVTEYAGDSRVKAVIADYHTNLVLLEKNGAPVWRAKGAEKEEHTDRSVLTVEGIIDFAEIVKIEDVGEIIERQISLNSAISAEGLGGKYGANIGSVLLKSYGKDIKNRAKAAAAAGSDARMSGCPLPVVIVSGSGNQGMTASLPVIEYAGELGADREKLIRALAVSDLVTIHLKTGIGRLSAYCGAVSAGAGAGAGIAYLLGGRIEEIAHTIVNALAIDSGIVCDGAKPSCAAKIAAAVDAGILGYEMYKNGQQFYGGDGIIAKGVENTIRNINRLGKEGMKETDKEIIRIMLEE